MASMIAGGLFNAVAFAGAGYLFSSFNKSGYDDEISRHDLAMEKLQKSKEEFLEQETKRKNKEMEIRAKIDDAKNDMKETAKAFNELRQIQLQKEQIPRLEDFYQPSDEMKKYQIMAVSIIGCGSGWLLNKLI